MERSRPFGWPMIGGVAAVAAIAGFGAAQFFKASPPSAPAEEAGAAATGPAEVKIPAQYLQTSNIVIEPVVAGAIGSEILAPATVSSTPQGKPSSSRALRAPSPGSTAGLATMSASAKRSH